MSRRIHATTDAGSTVYAVILASTGTFANGTMLEAYDAENWADYAVSLTEYGGSGMFYLDFPDLAVGDYEVVAYKQAGDTPAEGADTVVGTGSFNYDGTKLNQFGQSDITLDIDETTVC